MARGRRGISVIVIASLTLIALIVAYFIVDFRLRAYAEGRVEKEIASNLPDTVTGDVAVSIGGMSVIAQYLLGSFDRVELKGPGLVVNGVPASVQVVATDVPVDRSKPVGAVRAAVDLSQKSLNALLKAAGTAGDAELQLGDGDVSYAGTYPVLGVALDYTAIATPKATADRIVFSPTSAKVTTDAGALDVSGIVKLILSKKPITVCVAQYVPEGVDLTGVNVTRERARLTLASNTLMLSKQSLTTLGSCSAG